MATASCSMRRSRLVTDHVTAQKIQVPIAGVKELLLEADTNGANSGDHANWADAQFVKYGISGLADIYVDGVSLPEYDSTRFDYYVPITEGRRRFQRSPFRAAEMLQLRSRRPPPCREQPKLP